VDSVGAERNGVGTRIVCEAPVLTCYVAQCLTSLNALPLGSASLSARPLIEVHEGVAYVLGAGQRVLEPLACLGERVAHGWVHAKCLQGELFEPFRREELPQGEDEGPRIDLPRAEGNATIIAVADT
jgi:hypothetical protein